MRRPLFDTLRDLRSGQLIEDIEAKLQELVHAVTTTQAGGSLTIVLEVKPTKGSAEAVVVKDSVKLKVPQITSSGTLLFPTPEGNLQRNHPKQGELPGLALASDRPAVNA
jgi:hypothetical protein